MRIDRLLKPPRPGENPFWSGFHQGLVMASIILYPAVAVCLAIWWFLG